MVLVSFMADFWGPMTPSPSEGAKKFSSCNRPYALTSSCRHIWGQMPLPCTRLWSASGTLPTTAFTRNPMYIPQVRVQWDYDIVCIRSSSWQHFLNFKSAELINSDNILTFRGDIDDREWRFLLTGGVALENPFPNPAPDWLSDKSWAEVVRVSQLDAFDGFMLNFRTYVSARPGIIGWKLMPSSHLACDGSTEPVSCPYPPFRAATARPPAEAGGSCEIFVWIHGLRGLYDLV